MIITVPLIAHCTRSGTLILADTGKHVYASLYAKHLGFKPYRKLVAAHASTSGFIQAARLTEAAANASSNELTHLQDLALSKADSA